MPVPTSGGLRIRIFLGFLDPVNVLCLAMQYKTCLDDSSEVLLGSSRRLKAAWGGKDMFKAVCLVMARVSDGMEQRDWGPNG